MAAHQIVVHPYFKDQILNFEKGAIMLQENIKEKTILNFYTREDDNTEKMFATATAGPSSVLKILPKKGQIHRLLFINGVRQWLAVNPETTRRILLVEGFKHPDDFWNNCQARGTFETYQMYFENLKPTI